MNEQVPLAVFSLAATWCFNSPNAKLRRWGPLIGLYSQPFWVYAAVDADKGGMLLLSLVYTALYVRGAWNNRRAEVSR